MHSPTDTESAQRVMHPHYLAALAKIWLNGYKLMAKCPVIVRVDDTFRHAASVLGSPKYSGDRCNKQLLPRTEASALGPQGFGLQGSLGGGDGEI